MKTIIILLSVLTAAASPAWAADETAQSVVRRFAEAGDKRDVAALEAVLHPSFRVLFAMNDEPVVSVMTRAEYLDLTRAGKLGGAPRKVQVRRVEESGAFAYARVEMSRAGATFDGLITLVRDGAGWRVAADSTVMRVSK